MPHEAREATTTRVCWRCNGSGVRPTEETMGSPGDWPCPACCPCPPGPTRTSELESIRSIAEHTSIAQMLTEPLRLGEAWLIAVEVHGNARDKGGDSYMLHVARVAAQMATDEERTVAILHDALEDCGSAARANDLYHRIRRGYGEEIAEAVVAMTRMYSEPYGDYMRRLAQNPMALRVKIADVIDNSTPWRIAKLEPVLGRQLEVKYHAALLYLRGFVPGKVAVDGRP